MSSADTTLAATTGNNDPTTTGTNDGVDTFGTESHSQTLAPPLPPRIGPCALGAECTAKNQELSDDYRCRLCNKQLHGFISGCSQAKNPKDFRDGVICKDQRCFDGEAVPVLKEPGRADGAVSSTVCFS